MDINELLDKELTLEVPEYGTLKITPREFLTKRNEFDIKAFGECPDKYSLLEFLTEKNIVCNFELHNYDSEKISDSIQLMIIHTEGFGVGLLLPKSVAYGFETTEQYLSHALWYLRRKFKGNFNRNEEKGRALYEMFS